MQTRNVELSRLENTFLKAAAMAMIAMIAGNRSQLGIAVGLGHEAFAKLGNGGFQAMAARLAEHERALDAETLVTDEQIELTVNDEVTA